MKKIYLVLLCIGMIGCLFSACGKESESNKEEVNRLSTTEILANVLEQVGVPVEGMQCYLTQVGNEDNLFLTMECESLGENVEEIASVLPISTAADMFFVLKTDKTKEAEALLEEYRQKRIGVFTGYSPEEESKLKQCKVLVEGEYLALLVCEEYEMAEEAFYNALKNHDARKNQDASENQVLIIRDTLEKAAYATAVSGFYSENPNIDYYVLTGKSGRATMPDGTVLVEEVPGKLSVYDTDPIVEAYRTKDNSKLTKEADRAVLKMAKKILEQITSDGMSQYEKEKAVHDYLATRVKYDECALQYGWYREYSDQPYGALINNQAICMGYTTTFKLLMDMLDIECVVVKGNAYSDREDHAWNLVRLDDNCWYAVDVTWDAPIGGTMVDSFFNVDDKVLEESDHHWAKEDYPSATGGKYTKN